MANIKLQTSRAIAVTPSDTDDIILPQGKAEGCVLYVGTGGNLAVITHGGDTVTFVGILAGTFVPVQVKRVLTATTADDIIALW